MSSVTEAADGGAVRRLSTASCTATEGGRLLLTLGPPLAWMVVDLPGVPRLLLAFSFWRLDVFTSEVVHDWGFTASRPCGSGEVYRSIVLRTIGIAAAVTVTDIVLAFPLAYHAARIATPRVRNALLIAVVLPLWANYLVRVYAWRLILTPNGFLNWVIGSVGLGSPPARPIELGRLVRRRCTCGSRSRSCRSTRRSSGCRARTWRRRATWVHAAGSRSAGSCSR